MLSEANYQYTTNNNDNNTKSPLFSVARYNVLSRKLEKRQYCIRIIYIVDFDSRLYQLLDVSFRKS